MATFNYCLKRRAIMILSIITRCLIVSILLFHCLSYGAIDNEKLIYIEADSIKYEYKKGIVYYDGHVHATQGATKLLADKMIVFYNEHHKIKEVKAIGKLAQYQTLLHEDKDTLTASAEEITYFPLIGQVILQNQGKIIYNNSVFTGPVITYDMKNQLISSRPNQNSQAKIMLEPIKDLKNNS